MKQIFLFFGFSSCHLCYQYFNMFHAKKASTLTLFDKSFSSPFTFSLMALLMFTPLLSIANLGFGYGFQLGFKIFGNIWTVTALFIAAQLFATILTAVLFFDFSIEKGPFLGFLLSVGGLALANLWK